MIRVVGLLKNFLLLFSGCLLALIILEGLLRIFPPFEMRFKPDRIVLPVNKRYLLNNAGIFTKLPKTTVHTKNSLGFRGDPPPPDFGNYLTLLTIGGSTTECFYLSDGETWPDILGRKLARDFHQVWINNAGLDGATTHRHIILLEDYVVKLRPKVALFLTGINDVGYGQVPENGAKRSFGRRFLRTIANHSEVYSLGQNIVRYLVAQKRGLHHKEIDLKAVASLDRIPENLEKNTLAEYREKFLPFYVQRVERLLKISRENGIEPVLVTQPTLYGPGVDPVTGVDLEKIKVGENLNGRLMSEVVELYNEALREAARKEKIFLIDLAGEMPKSSAYYYDYLHYTEAGAEKVAEIIDNRLSPFLAARYGQFKR